MFTRRSKAEVTEQVFLCFGCGSEFSDIESQKKHEVTCSVQLSVSSFHGADLFYSETEGHRKTVCEICRAYFGEADYLQDHKLLHLNCDHICYLCDSYHVTYKLLAHHVTTDHRERLGIKENEEGVNEPYMCPVCVLRFSTLKGLQAHENIHMSNSTMMMCRICKTSMENDAKSVNEHLQSLSHSVSKRKLMNVFTCIHCNTNFPTRDSYAMHMMIRAKDGNCSAKRHVNKSTPSVPDISPPPTVIIKQEPVDDIEQSTSIECTNHFSQQQNSQYLNGSVDVKIREHSMAPASAVPISFRLGTHDRRFLSALDNALLMQWSPRTAYYSNGIYGSNRGNMLSKTCDKCGKVFSDRDDLAMHTMSVHTEEPGQVPQLADQLSPSSMSRFNPVSRMNLPFTGRSLKYYNLRSHKVAAIDTNRSPKPSSKKRSLGAESSDIAALSKRPKSAPSYFNGLTRASTEEVIHRRDRIEMGQVDDDIVIAENIRVIFGRTLEKQLALNNNSHVESNAMAPEENETIDENSSKDDGKMTANSNPRSQVNIAGPPNASELCDTMRADDTLSLHSDEVCRRQVHREGNSSSDNMTSDNEVHNIRSTVECCGNNIWMCKYCPVVFLDRTLYCLHMGMHNVNAPYQCNMCGYRCASLHEFSAHVLHFQQ